MGATPPEEIARQHAEACALIEARTPGAPRVDHGEVPLRWKTRPTASPRYSAPGAGAEDAPPRGDPGGPPPWCVSSRGHADVSPLVELIREGVDEPLGNRDASTATTAAPTSPLSRTNLWREENAAARNVRLTRPSHDAWGIKKIVLVFCEDFLTTIYTLPWYQRGDAVGEEMRAAVQPVLDVLGITRDLVVRCLLAGLPPGTTIPVHHDTGEWVRHTHRVHVPVIVPDPARVLFRCGPTAETLARVDCRPGHVFEMNNQAKHAVTNAGPGYRVHLILDYVDPAFFATRVSQNCPVRRVDLLPGERVTQTRRTIDRAVDAGTTPVPSFLVLGAQKAGTTALYEYLNQHPWVVRARRRETHCLDWRWDNALASTAARRRHCLSFYHSEGLHQHPSLQTGDSTPSYLLDYYRVIPRLKECFPHGPRLFVMTRDPLRRAASHHAMATATSGTPKQLAARGTAWRGKTLEEVCLEDVRQMKEDGLLPYWDLATRTLDQEIFDRFINSREEDAAWERYVTTRVSLGTGSYSPVARGLYALQCRQWFRSFPLEQFLVFRLEDVACRGAQWAANRALEHLGLPRFELPDVEKKNSRDYEDPLEGDCRTWLERFFAPHNRRFGRMMVEEMGYAREDWLDTWSYS